jgi:hypothetical protein
MSMGLDSNDPFAGLSMATAQTSQQPSVQRIEEPKRGLVLGKKAASPAA